MEVAGFLTGVVNVWLVTRQNIWSWPIGVANALFYTVVFARTGLYSDTGLQVVYFVLSLYGWWHWWRGGPTADTLPVTRTSRALAFRLSLIGVITWLLLWTITARIPGAALPHIDSALVAASLIAQWMMTRKLAENWLVWIVVDIIYVGVFINRQLPLTAVLYAVFFALAVSGHMQWRASWRNAQADEQPA
ncbi:MAG TPA: nicotinamide riboside transporter PnuC [Gemmatimonas aurantiaca]|nr:nicotinamide riboside transporter PnuC [Gemmatimonas aurantiaca]